MVDIKGIKKARLLHQLWRFSQAQGFSFFALPNKPMEEADFEEIIKDYEEKGYPLRFDYLMGKAMKCDISGDEFNSSRYDRDNGEGKGQLVVDYIRQEEAKADAS